MRITYLFNAALLVAAAGCGAGEPIDAPRTTPASPVPTTTTKSGPSGTCAEVSVNVSPVIPTVTLLIDQSGSMTASFSGVERWAAVYDTLMNSTDGIVTGLQDQVRFGLSLYSSNGGDAGGTCPMLEEVPAALNNFDAIDAVYAPARPKVDTPTGSSLIATAAALSMVAEPGPKVVVLATDGSPDTCTDPNPSGGTRRAQANAETVAAAEMVFSMMGIQTFVISVGGQVEQAHLQDMANAGVGLPADSATPAPYYEALDADALVNAFDDIITGVRSCQYALEGKVETVQAAQGTVTLDGQALTHGVDWQINEGETLELLGDACEELKSPGEHDVTASFPCGSIIL